MLGRKITWLLAVLVGVCGLLVALRALAGGPIVSFVTIARPLNLESAAAVCLLLAWMIRGHGVEAPTPHRRRDSRAAAALAAALVIVLAFYWESLWFPLTLDDYIIVTRSIGGKLLPGVLTQGDEGEAFRPLSRILFAVQGWKGSTEPAFWHGASLILHLANCVLVFLLARKMVAPVAATFAAALFGLHATHPEAVSWMTSRSDVLAALFLLSALLVFVAHWERPHWARQLSALVLVALAILSKESAYAFAPLAWLLLAVKENPGWRGIRTIMPFAVLEAALFAYRWQVLGGLGGYPDPTTGRSMFLNLAPLRIAKTLCWRLWAVLFYPVNWEVPASAWLGISLLLATAGLVALTGARVRRRGMCALAAGVMVSILPTLPLALVGVDLSGARVYYLPSILFALLVAAAVDALRPPALRAGVAASLLLFHLAALRHELGVWRSVTWLTEQTCAEGAAMLAGAPNTPAFVEGLPHSVDGVLFLGNGFKECVELKSGRKLPLLTVGSIHAPPPGERVLHWDRARRRLRHRTRPGESRKQHGGPLELTRPSAR